MAKSARPAVELRAVVYPQGQWWIAHCLEMDLVAEGGNPKAALRDLLDLARLQIATALDEGDLESIFRAAPPHIWALYTKGVKIEPPLKAKKPVDRFEAREWELVPA